MCQISEPAQRPHTRSIIRGWRLDIEILLILLNFYMGYQSEIWYRFSKFVIHQVLRDQSLYEI